MTSTTDTTDKPRILVEVDEEATREIMTSLLTVAGYECRVAATPTQTAEILDSGEWIDLVYCDMRESAENTLNRVIGRTHWRFIPVIVSTATLDIIKMMKVLDPGTFLGCLDLGCYDFLFRPVTREQLVFTVRRALQYRRLKVENLYMRNKIGAGSGIEVPLRGIVDPSWYRRNRE